MSETETETVAKGALVVISGGPYGVATWDELVGPAVTPFRAETAADGELGTYVGPHPTVENWHMVHVFTLTDGTELFAPLARGMFDVVPPEGTPEREAFDSEQAGEG